MILHNVMWESRPLPKIVRDPLAALSARGSFFVPAPPEIFLFGGWQADAWRFEGRKACGEGNLFGKRFSLPAPLPSKNFCRWVCARMEEPVKKSRRLPAPKLCTRAAWKSVPFEGRRRWRKGAKRNSWGEAEAIPRQPYQLVQTFRYVSRERWAPVLRIPCPFLGAVRLADLSCVLGSAAGRSAYRCRFRWFCSWGSAGACGSRSLHSRRYQRACITVCCHRRTG